MGDGAGSDVVLVHGTTQAPSGWDRLAAVLAAYGYRVHAVDLPVDRPELDAAGYAAIAAGQCPDAVHPIVVGHSAAGLLLPAIARRMDAAHLVWISATIPDPSGAAGFADEVRAHGPEMFQPEWLALTEPPTADPVVAAYFLFHDCDLATLRGALPTVRLFYPAAVYQQAGETLRDLPPSTYIAPAQGRSLRLEWMRRTARERLGVEPIEIEAGHCPHVSRPDEVARIIHDRSPAGTGRRSGTASGA